MTKIALYRHRIILGFIVYYVLILIVFGLYNGMTISEMMPKLYMVPLGILAGYLENIILLSRRVVRTREYEGVSNLFIVFWLMITIIGPFVIMFTMLKEDYIYIAGLAFVVAGMGGACKIFVADEEVGREQY